MDKERWLWVTTGTRDVDNFSVGIKPSESAAQVIERLRKDGGVWLETKFIPFHSMAKFEIREGLRP